MTCCIRCRRPVTALLLRHLLQGVPLRNRPARVREHVAPVSQLGARRIAAERDTADRVRRTDTIIVDHRNHQRHFLQPVRGSPNVRTSQQHKQLHKQQMYLEDFHPFPFSALKLLVGWQEQHPGCKELGVGWLMICTSCSSNCYHHLHHP